ncbi:hypothetical protein CDAR_187081 [Caerostris darwini]|uniref:Uncharacterized protein n=1 Tax=Caerostris darwini TaxID=1538125 RepID=A0AAV4X411_9ARAC|nr:hypothetical protein CDAR_187081 [Caerostris darwini]
MIDSEAKRTNAEIAKLYRRFGAIEKICGVKVFKFPTLNNIKQSCNRNIQARTGQLVISEVEPQVSVVPAPTIKHASKLLMKRTSKRPVDEEYFHSLPRHLIKKVLKAPVNQDISIQNSFAPVGNLHSIPYLHQEPVHLLQYISSRQMIGVQR